ncbi:DUF1573 domain-containing protein [Pedobacter frigiditerrae]|uniref:DUF1573 domain-containing protein n=1 Tax=Pedobacter frigiditerrae TaxID=2530452 RepID=A0A4R0MR66_9SPHI|nr:DUF1573 domain-containing protein [Pedobacter frigiditerrae]TCC89388.1 DUF1573 domain-containing protein [Pedobacter frigiditerrae]
MKNLFIILLALIAFTGCKQKSKLDDKVAAVASSSTATVAEADAPKVKFEKEIYDFGVITQGEKVQFDFKFKNTGKTPLIITDATATCGCTVPEYPKTPIKPGEEGLIKVVFDSAGKIGMQDKQVTIFSNANPEADKLHLVGEVKEKK